MGEYKPSMERNEAEQCLESVREQKGMGGDVAAMSYVMTMFEPTLGMVRKIKGTSLYTGPHVLQGCFPCRDRSYF